jgi:aspartate ammonia-lyase
MPTRQEHDLLGSRDIPATSHTGIHTARARENFRLSPYRTPAALIQALALVKKACAQANAELGYLDPNKARAIELACDEIALGELGHCFDLDALQGGAGTSTNMCLNEVIANRALELMELPMGQYESIHPLHHVNLHQSTNDVYPTAVKVAGIGGLRSLSAAVAGLQSSLQKKERQFEHIPTLGRTEWVDAVPITLGREFSAFAEAVSRDRWRTFKSEERLRVINLGGTAVGTGLTAPRDYIFLATEKLRQLTSFGLSRAENLMDQTANADSFVEVSGIMKAAGANLVKICGDLRFLHSTGEIRLPAVQAGSSVMPGKVNPVILEAVMQAGLKVMSNDTLVAECASRGTLQINEFMPLLALAFLESLDLLTNACGMLAAHVDGIEADESRCQSLVADTPALITAFLPRLGYEQATALAQEYQHQPDGSFIDFLKARLGCEIVEATLRPEMLNSLGYRPEPKV